MKLFNATGKKTAILGIAMGLIFLQQVLAQDTYIITGTDGAFTAEKDGNPVIDGSGVTLSNAISAIGTAAAGSNCTIQFGDGTDALDNGTTSATINGANFSGIVTITGKLKSATATGPNAGTLVLSGSVNAISKADITNTHASSGTAIRINGSGELEISGGTVSASPGGANVYIIYHNSIGELRISGGTVSGLGGSSAISSWSNGKIVISGSADITSTKASATSGTISLGSGAADEERLVITGGTVKNTVAGGNAIYNDGAGTVNIGGGTIQATTGYAKAGTKGVLNLTGGVCFAHGASAASVISGAYDASSGAPAIIAWSGGNDDEYDAGASAKISASPSTTTAMWINKGVYAGIGYANGANTGFISLNVKVNKKTLDGVIFPTTNSIVYDPTITLADVPLVGAAGDGTFAWEDNTIVPQKDNTGYNVVFTPTDADNYLIVKQIVSLTVTNQAGIFTPHEPVNAAYSQGLKLGDLTLEDGYKWVNANTDLNAGDNQIFAATFTDPSGEYSTADGDITVNVAKRDEPAPNGLTAIYGQTLADVEPALPEGWEWESATTTPAGNAGERTHKIKFTPTDADNYNALTNISVTVTVAKATPPYTKPIGFAAIYGQTLADVEPALPEGWKWDSPLTTSVGNAGKRTNHRATFTPQDLDNYNVVPNISITVDVAKASGASTSAPVLSSKTHNSVTISALTATENGQTVNYAINTVDTPPVNTDAWKTDLTFTGLLPKTDYYIFARTAESSNYNTGAASLSLHVITDQEGSNPISKDKKSDKKYGILLEKGIVSQSAKFTVKTPEPAQANLVVYDNIGNVVFESKSGNDKEILWDLTNSAGRPAANGSYLALVEAKGVSGKTYNYSTKLGIKR
ncbi:MAG: hypothetical protein LBH98_04865 [Chitinispirillales bacterium]|jgi:hypothetical protein|nr:hypothetical protein [Chitinispirillales bacterium]